MIVLGRDFPALRYPYTQNMEPQHQFWVEAIQNFIFAALFVVAGPSLARFLYRHTRCTAASMLVGIGMIGAAAGLGLLGMADCQYLQWNPDGSEPYATAAFVCQIGGAFIMAGALVFTSLYKKKLIDEKAVDPKLKRNALGLSTRI